MVRLLEFQVTAVMVFIFSTYNISYVVFNFKKEQSNKD